MTPKELMLKIQEMPSNNAVALIEGTTNTHIYDFHCGFTHISGTDNYFEISFDLPMKFIFRYLWIRFIRLFKKDYAPFDNSIKKFRWNISRDFKVPYDLLYGDKK